jgi:hypothetical protein
VNRFTGSRRSRAASPNSRAIALERAAENLREKCKRVDDRFTLVYDHGEPKEHPCVWRILPLPWFYSLAYCAVKGDETICDATSFRAAAGICPVASFTWELRVGRVKPWQLFRSLISICRIVFLWICIKFAMIFSLTNFQFIFFNYPAKLLQFFYLCFWMYSSIAIIYFYLSKFTTSWVTAL